MVTQGYKDYINSNRWKQKREQVFRYYGKRCFACRKTAKILHVHHVDYSRLGKEAMGDLIPLCVPCHREVTRIYKRNRRAGLRRVTMEFVRRRGTMEVRETDDDGRFEPSSEDDSALVGMMFERLTEMSPDTPMRDRADVAMAMFVVVKKWAHNLELTSDAHRIVETD